MSKINCNIGDTFGRLTLVKQGNRNKYNVIQWLCKCNCGNPDLCLVAETQLKSGKTKSCGCIATENKRKIGKNNIKISFKEWCINNNRTDILDLWDYKLNNELPEDVGYSSPNNFYFVCKDNVSHHPKYKLRNITKNGTNFQIQCYICNSFGYNLNVYYGDDALNNYWDYSKNADIDPFIIPKNTNKKLYIRCQENVKHGSYEVTGTHFWQRNQRCPYCSHTKIIKEESLGYLFPEVLDIWSDENKISPYEVSESSGKKVIWKCKNNKHNDYMRNIKDSKKSLFCCPKCKELSTESNLEKIVKSFIKSNFSYTINTEYNCSIVPINPKTKQKLPYDNELKEIKLIIEVHGEQHYKICYLTELAAKKYNTLPEEQLKYQKWKDDYKRDYALNNGYYYLEIPYWSIKDETYKDIISNKINEICYKKP